MIGEAFVEVVEFPGGGGVGSQFVHLGALAAGLLCLGTGSLANEQGSGGQPEQSGECECGEAGADAATLRGGDAALSAAALRGAVASLGQHHGLCDGVCDGVCVMVCVMVCV